MEANACPAWYGSEEPDDSAFDLWTSDGCLGGAIPQGHTEQSA